MPDELLGRNAQVVFRDKSSGKKRNMQEEQAKLAEEEAKKSEATKKYQQWNKGFVATSVYLVFICKDF